MNKTTYKKGHIPWIQGKGHSKETRLKMSLMKKGVLSRFWKGGITYNSKEYYALYRKKNRDKLNLYSRIYLNHRRRKLRSLTKLTKELLQLVYEDNIKHFGTLTCYLCLKPIKFGNDCLEHKTPVSRGGDNLYDNLGIACKSCNCKKNNKTVEEYERYLNAKQ